MDAPVENLKTPKFALTPKIVLGVSLFIMLAGAVSAEAWKRKALKEALAPEQLAFQEVREDRPRIYEMGCDGWYLTAGLRPCNFGLSDAKMRVVLIGDSLMAQWFSAFAAIYVDSGWRMTVLTKSGCPMVDESLYYSEAGGMYTVCDEWRESAIEFIEEMKPDLVIMGSAATYELKDWRGGSERIIASLSQSAGQILVIRAAPSLPFDGPNCLARKDWQPAWIAALSECKSPVSTDPDESVLSALQEASKGFENVRVLDFNELVCPSGICRAEAYRDNTHITDKFVRSITPQIRERIAEAQ